MAPLVEYEAQCEFMGIPVGTDMELILGLLSSTQALFEKGCGREGAPFGPAIAARTEIRQGDPGASRFYLDYPIASVTSIAVGVNIAVPDETITPTDTTKVIWQVGDRYITRVDGSVWRRGSDRWVKVVYATQADQPEDVGLEIMKMVAKIYQHRGKEGFTSVTRGSRSWTKSAESAASQDRDWQTAIDSYSRSWVR